MLKLINIELMKILKHKSVYIILIIVFLFCLLNNLLYKNDYDDNGFYKYEKVDNLAKYIRKLEIENEKCDLEKDADKSIYVNNKTEIDIAKIKKKYSVNDWRYIKAKDYLYDYVYNYNYSKYILKDNLIEVENIYKERLLKFRRDDWMYFANEEKNDIEEKLKVISNNINNGFVDSDKVQLEVEKRKLENNLVVLDYRLEKKINYSNTYLNQTLVSLSKDINIDMDKKKIKNLDYDKKLEYYNRLSNYYINKYIVNKGININKVNTLNYQLRTIVDDYELFVILIILVTSSIIVGEEFNKGTIKLLLIKPYKREVILFSKFISCFLMCLFTIVFIFLSQFLIGGILFGFSSLKYGVVVYNFNLSKIVSINVFVYMLLRILVKLPMFIIIEVISIILGIVLNSTIGSFSITMLIYTFSEVINKLAINYNIKFMKYFLTLNWNFHDYLFGGLSAYRYLDFKKSILIFLFYDIILMGIMFTSFDKKNIKNI